MAEAPTTKEEEEEIGSESGFCGSECMVGIYAVSICLCLI
jgi:hypothetical protein